MWTQLACAAIGAWLMVAPGVLGYGGVAATADRIVGPIAAAVAIVSMAEVLRGLRWANVLVAAWLVAAPWILRYEVVPLVNSLYCGLCILGLALHNPPGTRRFGGGWTFWKPEE
jgi:SPW repeat-containing protein